MPHNDMNDSEMPEFMSDSETPDFENMTNEEVEALYGLSMGSWDRNRAYSHMEKEGSVDDPSEQAGLGGGKRSK